MFKACALFSRSTVDLQMQPKNRRPHRRALFDLSKLRTFAGKPRSGQLFMAGCIGGGYKRRLLQTLNSPYINQTPTRRAAPRESEEGDAAPRFYPTHLRAAECIIVDAAIAAVRSMHSTEHYVNARERRRKHAQTSTISSE